MEFYAESVAADLILKEEMEKNAKKTKKAKRKNKKKKIWK